MYIANLGDSRAVLIDAQGKAQRLSVDHKPEDERHKIEARGGRVVLDRRNTERVDGVLAMARALGDLRLHVGRRPQITRIDLQPQATAQYLLLACDGIYDVLHDDVLAAFISKAAQTGRSPDNIAADLVRAAHARGSGDNLSAMLIPLRA